MAGKLRSGFGEGSGEKAVAAVLGIGFGDTFQQSI